MVNDYIPDDMSGFQRTVEDFVSTDTALTFGGVFTGVSLGEFIGMSINQQLSGGTKVLANVGVKSGIGIATRHFTKGKGTLDPFGIAMAAGLGADAVSDIVAWGTGKTSGFGIISNAIGGNVSFPSMPQIGGTTKQPTTEGNEKEGQGILARDVPIRKTQDEPLEEEADVI